MPEQLEADGMASIWLRFRYDEADTHAHLLQEYTLDAIEQLALISHTRGVHRG